MTRGKVAAVLAAVAALALPAGAAAAPRLQHLDPGQRADLRETVPVQFVIVGWGPDVVKKSAFLAGLPSAASPIVRSRAQYGIDEPVGLHLKLDYKLVYADAAWENAFFAKLTQLSQTQQSFDGHVRTDWQQAYNDEDRNVLDVGTNYVIDAPTVERYLAANPPAGVDTTRPTVFYVNWYGRPDFRFHTYVKSGEPDPDTGYDFGLNRQSRRLTAWGGTTPDDEETGLGGALGKRRVWFYDLSAGPESWTSNWNVDDADVDGDGVADYRLPPAWEYMTPGGYRALTGLTADLAKVARYVNVNTQVAPSPLYPPALSPPGLPFRLNLDSNTFEGEPGLYGSTYISRVPLVEEVRELQRNLLMSFDNDDFPFENKVRQCFKGEFFTFEPCYPQYAGYPAEANLFLYTAQNLDRFREGDADYEALLMNVVTNDRIGALTPLGYADDNWIDGTQSGVFSFLSPGIIAAGYGLTTTQIHEYGHHIGMPHPHDGYDPPTGVDYDAAGATYFVNIGDEVNSMMSYIDLNWDFSQFDRDNYDRWWAASYLTNANEVARRILASPDSPGAWDLLRFADQYAGFADTALKSHDYATTYDAAQLSYAFAVVAAEGIGIDVEETDNGWILQPSTTSAAQRQRGAAAKALHRQHDELARWHRSR